MHSFSKYASNKTSGGKTPLVQGLCLPNRSMLILNSVSFLDDLYVNQNAYFTKKTSDALTMSILSSQNVVFMDTFHKDYNATRKALSAAFFKNKL